MNTMDKHVFSKHRVGSELYIKWVNMQIHKTVLIYNLSDKTFEYLSLFYVHAAFCLGIDQHETYNNNNEWKWSEFMFILKFWIQDMYILKLIRNQ